MCGRAGVDAKEDELHGYFGEVRITPDLDGWFPPAEIFPTGQILTVRDLPDRGLVAQPARWSFTPSWWASLKAPKEGERAPSTFNARIESAASPMWRSAWAQRGTAGRCLVLATHWWEWKGEKGAKQRIRLTLPGHRIFAMAGLWSSWHDQLTATIITCPPAPDIAWVHDRMPMVLHPSTWPGWFGGQLGPDDLGPPPAGIVSAAEDPAA